MNIVWAYHSTADVPGDGRFAQHTARGGMPYTFIQDTNGGGDGGNGGGDGGNDGNGSSSVYTSSILGIIALFLFQLLMGA